MTAKFERTKMREQNPSERVKNFQEVPLGYSEEEAILEAKRCLQCKKPTCIDGCPVNVKIPEFIKHIADGEFEKATPKIQETHAFPAICGRVCPQENQCELTCVLNKKGCSIAIGHLERYAADWSRENDEYLLPEVLSKNGRKIGVIGSGPAGLVAAGELAKAGFDVTIFEALHEAGGVLVYGIPEFRLPKNIVKAEIENLEKLGVKIIKNFVVGQTATIDELMIQEGFEAMFVGSGAGLPMFLNIPGEDFIGVYSANEYLTRVNLMKAYLPNSKTPIIRGKQVVTVGGGNVAMDSARTALRLGAEKSMIVYRRTKNEMPARKEEIHHAEEEGIDFQILTHPIEIIANENGQVTGIKCIKMELGEPDESGRRKPKAIPNSEFMIDCDVVIVAIGNRPNPLIPRTTPDIETTKAGTIIVKDENGKTTKQHVYAGGDIVTGAATVILAMGAGKKAACGLAHSPSGL